MGGYVSTRHRAEETLMEAVYEGDAEAVRTHLAAGVDVNCFDDEQSRPLHVAVYCGHSEVMRILLNASADLEAKGQLDGTPLHVAATSGRMQAAALLLEAGAVVDALDESDLTPLHRAAARGHAEMIRLLIGHGAAINAGNVEHYTPLHVAAQNTQLASVEALLNAGAAADARTASGESPAELARRAAPGNDATGVVSALERAQSATFPSPPPSPPSAITAHVPSRSTTQLTDIPHEVLIEVARQAGAGEAVLALGATCRSLKHVFLNDDELWRRFLDETYAPLLRLFHQLGDGGCGSGGGGGGGSGGVCSMSQCASILQWKERCNIAAFELSEGQRLLAASQHEPYSWRQFAFVFRAGWMDVLVASGKVVLLAIHGHMYDVTDFIDEHPGDPYLLRCANGRDATEAFEFVGHSTHAERWMANFAVPELDVLGLEAVRRSAEHRRRLGSRTRDGEVAKRQTGDDPHEEPRPAPVSDELPMWRRWSASARDGVAWLSAAMEGSMWHWGSNGSWRRGQMEAMLD